MMRIKLFSLMLCVFLLMSLTVGCSKSADDTTANEDSSPGGAVASTQPEDKSDASGGNEKSQVKAKKKGSLYT